MLNAIVALPVCIVLTLVSLFQKVCVALGFFAFTGLIQKNQIRELMELFVRLEHIA